MRAAIYARKSTEQEKGSGGVDSVSVERQIEDARAFAQQRGWDVVEVFKDDAISGAEYVKRPDYLRLIAAIEQEPCPFDVLVVMEQSRLGRDTARALLAIEQIEEAGVQVWSYRGDRISVLEEGDEMQATLRGLVDKLESRRSSVRTREVMQRKAKDGHNTGTVPFGYRAVAVNSHKELVPDPAQVEIVTRIFTRYAEGAGITRIAHELNADAATQGLRKWSPPGIRVLLTNELYVGRIVYGKTAFKRKGGTKVRVQIPESKWVRAGKPELQIIPDQLWKQAHARHAERKASYLRATDGRLQGRPDGESQHLLAGFVVCDHCGGKLIVRSTAKKTTAYRYLVCYRYLSGGSAACPNGRNVRLDWLTDQLVGTLKRHVTPESIEGAVRQLAADADRAPEQVAAKREALKGDIARLDQQIVRLTEAIAEGGEIKALTAGIKAKETQVEELRARLGQLDSAQAFVASCSAAGYQGRVSQLLANWQEALEGSPVLGRQVLRKLLAAPIIVRPQEDGSIQWATATTTCASILGQLGGEEPAVSTLLRPGATQADLSAELKALLGAVRQDDNPGGPTS